MTDGQYRTSLGIRRHKVLWHLSILGTNMAIPGWLCCGSSSACENEVAEDLGTPKRKQAKFPVALREKQRRGGERTDLRHCEVSRESRSTRVF